MRFYNQILFSLFVAFLFSACDSDTEPVIKDFPSFAFALCPSTRATDTAFEEGDEIGIYGVKRVGGSTDLLESSGNYCDNKKKPAFHDISPNLCRAYYARLKIIKADLT